MSKPIQLGSKIKEKAIELIEVYDKLYRDDPSKVDERPDETWKGWKFGENKFMKSHTGSVPYEELLGLYFISPSHDLPKCSSGHFHQTINKHKYGTKKTWRTIHFKHSVWPVRGWLFWIESCPGLGIIHIYPNTKKRAKPNKNANEIKRNKKQKTGSTDVDVKESPSIYHQQQVPTIFSFSEQELQAVLDALKDPSDDETNLSDEQSNKNQNSGASHVMSHNFILGLDLSTNDQAASFETNQEQS